MIPHSKTRPLISKVALEDDPKLVVTVAARGQRAAKHILGPVDEDGIETLEQELDYELPVNREIFDPAELEDMGVVEDDEMALEIEKELEALGLGI